MARPGTRLLELGEALLQRTAWPSRAAIADAMSAPPGSLASWFHFLEFHRAIRPGRGALQISRTRLLSVLTSHRTANLRPERPLPLGADPREAQATLDQASIPYAMAMFSAANLWAFFEPRHDLHIYLDRRHVPQVRELLTADHPRRAVGDLQIYVDNLQAIPTTTRAETTVTTPLLTVLDLRAHPEGGAHADFLEHKLLPRIQEVRP